MRQKPPERIKGRGEERERVGREREKGGGEREGRREKVPSPPGIGVGI